MTKEYPRPWAEWWLRPPLEPAGGGRQKASRKADPGADADRQGACGCLALEFTPPTARPGGEELLEVFLVGGQALSEAVCGLLLTLACLQPTEAADTGPGDTCTCEETGSHRGPCLVLRMGRTGNLLQGVPSHTRTCHEDRREEKPGRK